MTVYIITTIMLHKEVCNMVAPQRVRPIAIRVMVTAQEQAELQKAADRAAMPVSVYVRSTALASARRDTRR
jgi:hypothetical protein